MMSDKLSPSRTGSRTLSTGIRVPATQGLPKWICGLTAIRSFVLSSYCQHKRRSRVVPSANC
jgi:hypothetical protein